MGDRKTHVGNGVVFHDEKGVARDALVTCVHGGCTDCINLLYVDPNEGSTDEHGRQIVRQSSVPHKEASGVHGFYWRLMDEKPNEYTPPAET